MVANVVMTRTFAAITNMLDVSHLRESIKRNVQKAFAKLNLSAVEKGYEYGKTLAKS
jgi:Pyruvate/2-oxoacid:ferredoxin oxidoreductase gamma subunit